MREPWAAPQVAPRGAFGPRNPLYGDESHGARFFDQFATALDALDCLGKQELGLAVENASVSGAFVEPGAELFDGQGLKCPGIQDLDHRRALFPSCATHTCAARLWPASDFTVRLSQMQWAFTQGPAIPRPAT